MSGAPGIAAVQFLFGGGPAATQNLSRAFHGLDAADTALRDVRRVRENILRPVDEQIAVAVTSQLDHDLGAMLLDGWHRYRAVRQAAEESLADPATPRYLDLVTHTVTAIRHPRVDVLVDGNPVYSFELDLEGRFELASVAAVIREGCLTAFRGGDCRLALTLRWRDHTLASQEGKVDLAVLIPLDAPIPLTDEAARRLRLGGG